MKKKCDEELLCVMLYVIFLQWSLPYANRRHSDSVFRVSYTFLTFVKAQALHKSALCIIGSLEKMNGRSSGVNGRNWDVHKTSARDSLKGESGATKLSRYAAQKSQGTRPRNPRGRGTRKMGWLERACVLYLMHLCSPLFSRKQLEMHG